MGQNSAEKYSPDKKKKFVKFYREHQDNYSVEKARDEFFQGEKDKPTVSTVWRWNKKAKNNRLGDSDMAENDKDKSAVDKIVHGSQVSEGESNGSADNYTGGDNDSSETKPKEKKKSGNSSKNQSLDISKVPEWIKDHKMQIGLAAAGIAVVVLVSRFRHTISVDELQGHGEGSPGESGPSENDSGESEGLSDDGAWTGE